MLVCGCWLRLTQFPGLQAQRKLVTHRSFCSIYGKRHRLRAAARLQDFFSRKVANNMRKVAKFLRPMYQSRSFKRSPHAIVSMKVVIRFCVTRRLGDGRWMMVPLKTPFRMITWSAPKFSSQASQFVPVPHKKKQTQNFASALRASPFGHAGFSMKTVPKGPPAFYFRNCPAQDSPCVPSGSVPR